MGGLSLASCPTRSDAVDSVDIDGDVLLYDGKHLRLLAGTAAAIWRALDGGTSVQEVLAALAPGDAEGETAVLTFLDELVGQGLIHVLADDALPRYVVREHVAHVADGVQTLLLDAQTGVRRALSESASVIWQITCARPDLRGVVTEVRRTYPDAPASLEAEVARLLDELVAAGFLIRHPRDEYATP